MKSVAVLASTGGGVLEHAMKATGTRERVAWVLSDRTCGAIDKAAALGCRTWVGEEVSFSDALLGFCREQGVDYVISAYYTRLLQGELLGAYRWRLFNLHASILPAYPGRHSVRKTVQDDLRIMGATAHVIDDSMDGGPVVLQSAVARPYGMDMAASQHVQFQHGVKMLRQLVAWLADDRFYVDDGRPRIRGARFDDAEFSPALDDPAARQFGLEPFQQAGNQ